MKTSFWRLWWRSGKRRPVSHKKPRQWNLQVEQLEDRTLLSGTPQLLLSSTGIALSNPTNFVVIGSTAYFAANDGTHGSELWKTDGTAAGTSMVADINPGSAGSYPGSLTNFNGELFFAANDGTHGYELWKSDGTAAGTVMAADINTTFESTPGYLTNVNGTLFFADGSSLWKSDGTAAGTVQVSSAVTNPSALTNVNGELFFSGYDGTNGQELWKSDGTAAGTTMVKDIYPGTYTIYYYGSTTRPNSSSPNELTNVNGTLYFAATDGNGTELWKSDGTAAGTVSLTGSVNPSALTNVNGTLFFGESGSNGGLYKSDGTAAGTVRLAPSIVNSQITNINGELYFAGNGGVYGTQLWKSDGTAAGTTMVKDINPGTTTTWYYTGSYGTYTRNVVNDNANPDDLRNVNGTLYFAANDGTHGVELWKSDGTASGTTMVQDINPGSHTVSYTNFTYYGGTETRSATLPNSSYPSSLTNLNGTLLFSANDGVHGNELWMVPTGPSLALSAGATAPTAGVADTFTISALNADGTPDTTLSGAVNITVSDAKASFPSSITLTNGTAQFNVTFETAGPQSVSATDVQNPSDQGSESDLVVQAAQASSFALSGFPSPQTAGLAGSFTVSAYDQYGNVATGYTGTVHFTSNDPHAVLPADATLTSGTGQFSATLKTLGTNLSITATDKNNSILTATQSGIEVIPFVSIAGPYAGAINQPLTYTLGAGADPVGTVFTVNWGDGSSTQTTATTVTHIYTTSAFDQISVTATAAGLTSNKAIESVNIVPVTVTIEADPALAGAEVLVVASTANYENLVLGGNSKGVSLTYDGTALGTIPPTSNETLALVEVFAGGSNDILDGRGLSVSSVLVGGPGNDRLYGGSGRNLLIGGAGSDTLYAGSAGDILIGSTTSFDANTAANQKALAFIMAEWDSTASYSARLKQLSGKAGSHGLNGSYFLNSTTVFNDNATDWLYGYSQASGNALDWFFAHYAKQNGDKVYNRVSGEVVTKI